MAEIDYSNYDDEQNADISPSDLGRIARHLQRLQTTDTTKVTSGIKTVKSAGGDPLQFSMADLQKFGEESPEEKAAKEKRDSQETIYAAIAAAAPAVVGQLAGGWRGGAAGAQIGADTSQKILDSHKGEEAAAQARRLAIQKILAAKGIEASMLPLKAQYERERTISRVQAEQEGKGELERIRQQGQSDLLDKKLTAATEGLDQKSKAMLTAIDKKNAGQAERDQLKWETLTKQLDQKIKARDEQNASKLQNALDALALKIQGQKDVAGIGAGAKVESSKQGADAKIKSAEIGAGAKEGAATKGAESKIRAAEIGAGAKTGTAVTGANAKLGAATIGAKGAFDVATTNADAKIKAAQIAAAAKGGKAGADAAAIGSIGDYVVAPHANPTKDDVKKFKNSVEAFEQIESLSMDLGKLIKRHGTEVLPTRAKDEMSSKLIAMQLKLKELNNLGVLNGPDLMLLNKQLPNPTEVRAGLKEMMDPGRASANLDHFNESLRKIVDASAHVRGFVRPGQPSSSVPTPQPNAPALKAPEVMSDAELNAELGL